MTNPAVASQLESGASTGCYADYGKGGLFYLVLAIWLLIPREDIGAKSRTTAGYSQTNQDQSDRENNDYPINLFTMIAAPLRAAAPPKDDNAW